MGKLSRAASFALGPAQAPGWGGGLQIAAIAAAGALLGAITLAVFLLPSPWGILFAIALLCPFAVPIVGDVRRILLALLVLDIPLQLGTHLDYRLAAGAVGAIGGLDVSATTVSLAVLYLLWIGEALTREKSMPLALPRVSLPLALLALYLGFAALSTVAARDRSFAFFELFILLQSFLLYVYVAGTVRSRRDVLFVVTMLLIGLLLESLIMLATQLLGPGFSIPGLLKATSASGGTGSISRLGGTFGSPNAAAGYLEMLLAPAIALLLARVSPAHRVLATVAFGLGGLALIGTFSRGGWMAFAVSAAILCLLAWRRGWLSPLLPLAVAVAAVLLGMVFQDAVMARLSDQEAAAGRLPLMDLAFRMIQDRPLLGIGPNNFAVSMKQYLTPDLVGSWLYTVHNKYLLVWAETGLFGLAAFLLFLAATLRQGWLGWRSDDRFLALVALGFSAAIVGQMTHMMVDIFNDRPQVQLLWLVAALMTALQDIDRRSRA